jgi:hypothetical protein
MSESIPNFLTSIAATSLVIIWFIHTGLLIGFDKKYKKSEMLNVVTKLYIFKYSSIIKGKNVNIS